MTGVRNPHAVQQDDADAHKGAVEGDRPTDEQQFNENAVALDEKGEADDDILIAQDVIGANLDETQG
jgi:hypothetical protein